MLGVKGVTSYTQVNLGPECVRPLISTDVEMPGYVEIHVRFDVLYVDCSAVCFSVLPRSSCSAD